MDNNVVSKEEWLTARRALLRDEKALIRYKDSIAERRRNLPWVKVEQEYVFETKDGKKSLAEFFNGHSQLIVYHFMFGPDWEEGCVGCSQVADTFNFAVPHIENRDAAMIAVSRASLAKLTAHKKRMGWSFEWVSSLDSEFNYDFDVSYKEPGLSRKRWNFQTVEAEMEEMHGISVFAMREDGLFHTYSCYARGVELMMVHLQYLDLCPKGRQDGVFKDQRRA